MRGTRVAIVATMRAPPVGVEGPTERHAGDAVERRATGQFHVRRLAHSSILVHMFYTCKRRPPTRLSPPLSPTLASFARACNVRCDLLRRCVAARRTGTSRSSSSRSLFRETRRHPMGEQDREDKAGLSTDEGI